MKEHQSDGYFVRRGEEERAAAERASDERAAQTHRKLANEYDRLANGHADITEEKQQAVSGILAKEFRILP